MLKEMSFLNKASTGKLIITFSILVSIYWILGNSINLYKSAVVGEIFEILWLPMLLCIFLLPILSIIIVIKKKTQKLFPILSILIIAGTVLFLSIYR
jgi:hypothetical protein